MPSPSTPSSPVSSVRLRSIHAAVKLMNARVNGPADPLTRKRRLVADLCRILAGRADSQQRPVHGPTGSGNGDTSTTVSLSPRMRQTLERLLAGDSEKEIAARLRLSRHTVHVYVKTLYRRFDVCSRGELCARFIDRRRG